MSESTNHISTLVSTTFNTHVEGKEKEEKGRTEDGEEGREGRTSKKVQLTVYTAAITDTRDQSCSISATEYDFH